MDISNKWEKWVSNPNSEIDKMMAKAAFNKLRIKITDIDDIVYEGVASTYTKADDEESGISSITINTDDKGGWGLFENEIKSIEEIKGAE